jgi:hypothetical protein
MWYMRFRKHFHRFLFDLFCVFTSTIKDVPPKTLRPQVTTPFSQHLCVSTELTIHGQVVKSIQSRDDTRLMSHLGCVCAQGLLNHFPRATLFLIGAQGLFNYRVYFCGHLFSLEATVRHFVSASRNLWTSSWMFLQFCSFLRFRLLAEWMCYK